ncbi:MAG: ABC1 kinase family protein, partial [bacterium]
HEYCSEKIMVMERIKGISLRDIDKIKKTGYDLSIIADQVFKVTLKMFFEDGFFHADPHAGNVFVIEGGRLALIDFGMVGYMDQEARASFYDCFSGMFQHDINRMIRGYMSIGVIDEDLDEEGFKNDLVLFSERYFGQHDQVNLSSFFNDVMSVAKRHRMKFPPYFFFVGKTFAVMEGTIKKMTPDFDFEKHSHRFLDRFMRKRLTPDSLFNTTMEEFGETSRMLRTFPRRLDRLTRKMDRGTLKFVMEMVHTQENQDLIEKLVNRLASAFLLAGMIVGSSIIVISHSKTTLFGLPVLGVFGFSLSFFFGFFIIFSIYRSRKW